MPKNMNSTSQFTVFQDSLLLVEADNIQNKIWVDLDLDLFFFIFLF